MSKFTKINRQGNHSVKTTVSASIFYLQGSTGGAVFTLKCHGITLSVINTSEPIVITHGVNAPLILEVTGGSGIDCTLHSYTVE